MKVMDFLTSSHAQQIGGRAGRYKTQYEDGEVTTFFQKDIRKLHTIVNSPKTPVEVSFIRNSVYVKNTSN